MNERTDKKTNERFSNEADKFLQMLYGHGIVSPIINQGECKMQIVKLGLTVPNPTGNSLLVAVDGQKAAYVFSCIRDRKCSPPPLNFMGFVFDIAMYRSSPLRGVPDARQAVRFFAFAVAQLEGFDWKNCAFNLERPILN